MIQQFAVVKLFKAKYNPEHVTINDLTPRVLILRTYTDSNQYLVRYPDGFIHRVNADWITTKSVFEPGHVEYVQLAKTMPAVEKEFRRSEVYRDFLYNTHPIFAHDLQQIIEAKNRIKAERNAAPPFTMKQELDRAIANASAEDQAPTPNDLEPIQFADTNSTQEVLKVLTSIDNHLVTLIQLWGGKQ